MKRDIKDKIEIIQRGKLPEGYRESKIGAIPERWDVIKLNVIADRITRINDGDKHPVLTISSLGGFLNQSERFSKVIAGDNLKKYTLIKKGEFSYNKGNSKTYPCGCIFKLNEYNTAVIPNVYYSFDIPSDSKNFYEQYFKFGKLNQQLAKVINTGVRNDGLLNLNVDDFFKSLIIRPPLKEQQEIAEILSTWDKVIQLKEKLIELKKEQKRGLMSNLLTGKIRLPGFEGEWDKISIRKIAKIKGGNAFPEEYQNGNNGNIPFYKVSDMNNIYNNKYMTISNNFIDMKTLNKIKATIIERNSIIFAKVGAAVFLERKRILRYDSCIDNNLMALTLKQNLNIEFIYYKLLNSELSKLSNMGALPSINGNDVGNLKIKIPTDLNEQKAIAKILTTVDKEINLLQQELELIKQQKKGLMQLLLTGIVRVNDLIKED